MRQSRYRIGSGFILSISLWMLFVIGASLTPVAAVGQESAEPELSAMDHPSTPGSEPPVAVERVVPPLFFGMQMHSLMSIPEEHRQSSRAAASLGARFVRDECFWHMVESKKGQYRIPETQMENFRFNKLMGLETLLILDYTNDFYDDGQAPRTDEAREAFGRYCYHVAKELQGICTHFEVWNEPNTDGFWRPKKDAEAYAKLMEVAIREVKRGNPEAVVFGGALSGIDAEYMTMVCTAVDCTAMDVFSMHPYCTPRSPGQANIFNGMQTLQRTIFPDPATRRPIWVTEIGYPTNEQGGVSEWRQAEAIAQTYLLGATRPELEGVVWYWMGPDGPDPLWAEDRFGLFHMGFKGRKPAAFSFETLARLLPGTTIETTVDPIDGIEGSRIIRMRDAKNRPLTALYVEEGEWAVRLPGTDTVEVIPLTGAASERLVAPEYGDIQLTVSPLPVLVRSGEPLQVEKAEAPMMLFARSDRVARGGRTVVSVATRRTIEHTPYATTDFWPGELRPEEPGAAMPWKVSSLGPGAAAEARVTVAADQSPQIAPVIGYWIPPDAEHPAARLTRTFEVVDPVSLDIRGIFNRSGQPTTVVAIRNETDDGMDVTVQVHVEGRETKEFELKDVGVGVEKLFAVPVESLDSPDTVLKVDSKAKLAGGVTVEKTGFVSFMPAVRMTAPPVIDGDLSDWPAGLPAIHLGKRSQIVAERDEWEGPGDASARVWVGWDKEWLYLAAEIYDDVHVEEATGFTVYNNDGLEVYIDTARETGRKRDTYTERQFQYGLFPTAGEDVAFEFHHTKLPSAGARIKINRSPKRGQRLNPDEVNLKPNMIIEASIPMSELGLDPLPGMELGFSVALNDDDSPQFIHPFTQDLQMQWSRQRNVWQRPSAFVSLWLFGPPAKRDGESGPNTE